MLADVDWDNLSVAGAFLLGAIFATVATLRIMRLAVNFFKQQRDEET